jgi:hypothetical protein
MGQLQPPGTAGALLGGMGAGSLFGGGSGNGGGGGLFGGGGVLGGSQGGGSLFGASGSGADGSRPASGLFAPTTSSSSVTSWGGAPPLTNPWGGGAAVNFETGNHDGGSGGDISAQVRAAKEKIAGKLL